MTIEDLEHALREARSAIEARPEDWRGHAQAGALLLALGRTADAIPALRQAAAMVPSGPQVLNNLAVALMKTGQQAEAEALLERAVALDPAYRDAACNLARVLARAGERSTEQAIARLERAVELDPELIDARSLLGNALLVCGRVEDARACFLEAIERAPHLAQLYRYLAETDPLALADRHMEAAERLLHGQLHIADRIAVHFALGMALDARGEYARAFEHFAAGNAASHSIAPYDESQTMQSFAEMAAVFSAETIRAHAGSGYVDNAPVFIIGMPRSGTSLTEQILATHPLVYGAGELELFGAISDAVFGRGSRVTPQSIRDVGRRYAQRVRAIAGSNAVRITDKMPSNFRYAGLIHLALPQAKLIHVRRDPLDTSLSCFTHTFAGNGLSWTFDLGELGRYYRAYADLMEHWRAVLPEQAMLEVRYEDLVADFEAQARRIVAFCGLPWDDRCLRFHETKRDVRTASAAQVRKPLYRDAIGRAQKYGDLLQPLAQALGLTT